MKELVGLCTAVPLQHRCSKYVDIFCSFSINIVVFPSKILPDLMYNVKGIYGIIRIYYGKKGKEMTGYGESAVSITIGSEVKTEGQIQSALFRQEEELNVLAKSIDELKSRLAPVMVSEVEVKAAPSGAMKDTRAALCPIAERLVTNNDRIAHCRDMVQYILLAIKI